jgi:uncharacterized membrane protein
LIKRGESKDFVGGIRNTHSKKLMDEASEYNHETDNGAAEKGGIVGPIFLTLFILAITAGLVSMPFFVDKEPLKGLFQAPEWWTKNIGEYHPLILHLPIGIIVLTVLMEVCSWFSFGRYRPMTGVGLFLAFIAGAFACVTGFFDLNVGGMKAESWDDAWFQHMWLGIIFVGILGLAFLAKIWGRRSGARGPIYGILLFGAAGVMGYAAHIGGVKVHKTDPVENTLRGLGIIKDGAVEDDKEGDVVIVVPPKDRLAYAEVVVPILENRCYSCHSEKDDNGKGELWMDTYENLLFGGELQDDEPEKYSTLVPGDVEKSYMISVLNLPLEDDMHMPPKKKKQLDAHEIELLTWWVANLPAGKTLEDKTLEGMGAPQNILDAVAKMVSPEERKAMEEKLEAEKAQVEAEKAAKREALQSSLNTLKEDEAFKTSLDYASQDSSDLEFSAVSLRDKFNDETFVKLEAVAESLTSLGLGATSVTEGALVEQLPKMVNLRKLNLSETETGDGAMDAVAKLDKLRYLNLYGTQVTDAGLAKLKTLVNLESLYLWQSKATPAGGEALQKELPGLEVIFGAN